MDFLSHLAGSSQMNINHQQGLQNAAVLKTVEQRLQEKLSILQTEVTRIEEMLKILKANPGAARIVELLGYQPY